MYGAVIFQGTSRVVMFGSSLLVFFERLQKFRPILRPLQHYRCLPEHL